MGRVGSPGVLGDSSRQPIGQVDGRGRPLRRILREALQNECVELGGIWNGERPLGGAG